MTAQIRLLLRDLRQERSLSQEELARALNLSRQSIISLERGEYLPSSPVLLALMEFFNCPIEQLVDGINITHHIVTQNKDEEIEKGGEQEMNLTPWSPFQAVDQMREEMNDIVQRTLGGGDWSRTLGANAGAMNIHETEQEYRIEVQVPGYSDSDVSIEMTDDTLTITGTKKTDEQESKGKSIVRREWQHSEFTRQVRFTTPIKEEKVEAKLENGTLVITAPKVEPVKPKIKKIEVKKK